MKILVRKTSIKIFLHQIILKRAILISSYIPKALEKPFLQPRQQKPSPSINFSPFKQQNPPPCHFTLLK